MHMTHVGMKQTQGRSYTYTHTYVHKKTQTQTGLTGPLYRSLHNEEPAQDMSLRIETCSFSCKEKNILLMFYCGASPVISRTEIIDM